MERKKIIRWVHAVASELHFCEGIKSTSHPESTRDYVSKSGKSEPGWYNFEEDNGARLEAIKKRRDPRNVFSLASRVSWRKNEHSVEKHQSTAKAKTERVEAMRSVRRDKTRTHDDSDGEDDASLETTDDRFEEKVHEEDDSDEDEVERRDGRSRMNHQASSRSSGQETYMTDYNGERDEDNDWADFDEHDVDEQRQVPANRDDATERSLTPSPASSMCVGREVVEV